MPKHKLIFGIVMLLLVSFVSAADFDGGVYEPFVTACHTMNDDDIVVSGASNYSNDSSGNGNNAWNQGDARTGVSGAIGGGEAYEFDGDDYLNMSNNPTYFDFGTSDFSYYGYVRTSVITGYQTMFATHFRRSSEARGWSPTFYTGTGAMHMLYSTDGSSYTDDERNDSVVIVVDEWMFVAYGRSGNTAWIATNVTGEIEYAVVHDATGDDIYWNTIQKVWIGATWDDGGGGIIWAVQGKIDNVVLFNKSLSLDELKAHYGNQTECDELITVEADTTNPTISFVDFTTNTSSLNQDYISANVTATDANLNLINITLFNATNGNKISSSSSASSPLFNNFTSLSGGNYSLNATATDDASNINYTETRYIFLDAVTPTLTLNVTNQSSVRIGEDLRMNITMADDFQLGNYTFSWDNGSGFVNDSSVDLGTNTTFLASITKSITAAYGQTVQWIWFVYDYVGNLVSSVIHSFDVESTAPTVVLNHPVNNTVVADETFAILNVTPTDADGDLMNVSYYNADGNNLIGSADNISSGSVATFNWTGLTENTNYSWYVNVTDGVNVTISDTQIFATLEDILPPVITESTLNLTNAVNATEQTIHRTNKTTYAVTQSTLPNYEFYLNEIGNCSIGTDNLNHTAMIAADANTLCSGTLNSVSMACPMPSSKALSEGENTAHIACIDTTGNENLTAQISLNIRVDSTAPATVLTAPENDTWSNSKTVTFQGNVTEQSGGIVNVTLYDNETSWSAKSTNTTCLNNSDCSISKTFTTDGNYLWTYFSYDDRNNSDFAPTNQSIKIDSVNPTIDFASDSTISDNFSQTWIVVNASATDDNSGVDTICLYIFNSSLALEYSNCSSAPFLNGSLTDGIYYTNATVNDSAGNVNETATRSIRLDNVPPTIVTDFLNNSVYFLENITGQFNLSDDVLLHSFNISIDDKVLNHTEHLHTTTHQYNLSFNVTNLSRGIHNLTVFTADTHTAASLKKDYESSNGMFDNYMKYDFVEGGYIRTELKVSSVLDKWTTRKAYDRYTQTLTPAKPSDTITLIEESDKEIFIITKPGAYKGQWIIFGDHWKDYVLWNEQNSRVSIKRINKYKVEVTISGIQNTKELVFESIGDLNIATAVYQFSVVGARTPTFADPISELQSQTLTFRLNKTTAVTTAAYLTYNGTQPTLTNTSFSTYDLYSSTFIVPKIDLVQENLTINWEYNFISPTNNEAGNYTFNQTVSEINFDNCSTYTTVAINMTVKNETSGDAIIDNTTFIKGYFRAWRSLEENYTDFNLTWGGDQISSYSMCINPGNENFTMNAQMEYGATGFTTKLYYFNDYAINNVTKYIDLFLAGGTTAVTLTVKDFDDSVVPGAVIKVLSYDLPTDTSTITEIVETDSSGEAIVQLILDTEWYAFIVEVNGVIKLQTVNTIITTTTKTLRIDLEDVEYFDRYDVSRGTTHDLTWTNSTQSFWMMWSDGSGDVTHGGLKVDRFANGVSSVLYDDCELGIGGTKTYVVTDNITNQVYTAVTSVKFSGGERNVLETLTISFAEIFKIFGLTGIFMSFLMVLTLIGIGIWHPVPAVLLGLFGLFITITLDIFYVTPGILMGLIIMGGILLYKLTKN